MRCGLPHSSIAPQNRLHDRRRIRQSGDTPVGAPPVARRRIPLGTTYQGDSKARVGGGWGKRAHCNLMQSNHLAGMRWRNFVVWRRNVACQFCPAYGVSRLLHISSRIWISPTLCGGLFFVTRYTQEKIGRGRSLDPAEWAWRNLPEHSTVQEHQGAWSLPE